MARQRTHQYRITSNWTGNSGTGTSAYTAYSRSFESSGQGKCAAIPGSSDPAFRGDPARYNPEELLVAAVSSCHMLWVLHLCSDAGIVVTEYTDEAWGEMVEHADGSGEMTGVVLRPRMCLADPTRAPEVAAIHDRAHSFCCLARSVRFPVRHEPEVLT
jgi:organic hydroperoxide reductase OsmC/OhrA